MKYFSGEEVHLGDVVTIQRSSGHAEGTVVAVLVPTSKEALLWDVPSGGIVIEGMGLGLSLTERPELDPELRFVRRGTGSYDPPGQIDLAQRKPTK